MQHVFVRKVLKIGSSYGFTIPYELFIIGDVKEGEHYKITIEKIK